MIALASSTNVHFAFKIIFLRFSHSSIHSACQNNTAHFIIAMFRVFNINTTLYCEFKDLTCYLYFESWLYTLQFHSEIWMSTIFMNLNGYSVFVTVIVMSFYMLEIQITKTIFWNYQCLLCLNCTRYQTYIHPLFGGVCYVRNTTGYRQFGNEDICT